MTTPPVDASGSRPISRKGRIAAISALTLIGLGTFLVLGLLVVTKKHYIASSSMSPTLNPNDFVAFVPPAFIGEPKRGDVAAFWVDFAGSRVTFVMRIVGLPGDRVAVKDSMLVLNGEPVPRREVPGHPLPKDVVVGPGARTFEENLPDGRRYHILDDPQEGPFDQVQEVTVPPGRYFAMGDNRDNANDSRGKIGMIARDDITGFARMIYFAYDETGIRFDRIGTRGR